MNWFELNFSNAILQSPLYMAFPFCIILCIFLIKFWLDKISYVNVLCPLSSILLNSILYTTLIFSTFLFVFFFSLCLSFIPLTITMTPFLLSILTFAITLATTPLTVNPTPDQNPHLMLSFKYYNTRYIYFQCLRTSCHEIIGVNYVLLFRSLARSFVRWFIYVLNTRIFFL